MPELGSIKYINLMETGGGGGTGDGQLVQHWTADGTTTAFTITLFTPDSANLTVSVKGIEWTSGWQLIGNQVVFDFPPKKGSDITAEN